MTKEIKKVMFTYRDLSAPEDEVFGCLASPFVRRTHTFESQEALDNYIKKHLTLEHKGCTLTLLWYDVSLYYKVNERRIDIKRI